ncbi:protein kinase, putative, partial [Entamoeba invadens IP1]
MSLGVSATPDSKALRRRRLNFNSDCLTFIPSSSNYSSPRRESLVSTPTLRPTDFMQMTVDSVTSELYYNPEMKEVCIVHIVVINTPEKPHFQLHKLDNEFIDLDNYVKSIFESPPTFPRKSLYPLRDVEITQYLQEVICLDRFFDALFTREFFKENRNVLKWMSLHHPQLSGVLMKEGYLLRRWKERFVVVKNTFLFYFVNEKSMLKLEQPHSVVNLNEATLSTSQNNFTFKITTKEKLTFNFMCKNETELNEWIVALNSVICFKPYAERSKPLAKRSLMIDSCNLQTSMNRKSVGDNLSPTGTELLLNQLNGLKEDAGKLMLKLGEKDELYGVLQQIKKIQLVDLNCTGIVDYYTSKLIPFLENKDIIKFWHFFRDLKDTNCVKGVPKLSISPLSRYSTTSSSSTQNSPRGSEKAASQQTQCRLCNNFYNVEDLTKHNERCVLQDVFVY